MGISSSPSVAGTVFGVELMARGQVMQGLEGHTRHLDFTLSVILAHGRILSRGTTHLMF